MSIPYAVPVAQHGMPWHSAAWHSAEWCGTVLELGSCMLCYVMLVALITRTKWVIIKLIQKMGYNRICAFL